MFFDRPARLIGSRGSRRSAGVRSTAPPPTESQAPPKLVALALPVRRADSWMDKTLRFLVGRRAAPATVREPESVRPVPDVPARESSLDRGVRDIRRRDPGFDPSRMAGYVGMMFRTAHDAWTTGDIGPLRDRVTAELHGEMQSQFDRLKSAGQVNRVADIEVTATVTEAWQEHGRDYVTAHISGSMIDYILDEVRDRVVDGARELPSTVDEFWTFTRPAGLNFWMLSGIQT
jgi:predicted lipid-binding transport protein (Tim44 family)